MCPKKKEEYKGERDGGTGWGGGTKTSMEEIIESIVEDLEGGSLL